MIDHVMIDLETLDDAPTAAIIAIGAVRFDPETSHLASGLYYRVDWESAMERGTVSASAIKWWMKQSKAARLEVIKPGMSLDAALEKLANFVDVDDRVWGNGATYDVSILEHAYGHGNAPWEFWNVRDVRTVVDLAHHIGISKPRIDDEDAHHALKDAEHQAKYVSEMWQALTGKGMELS